MTEMKRDPRYPVGTFMLDKRPTPSKRRRWIGQIAAVPREVKKAVRRLTPAQLNAPYRKGGWTRRQVVHHMVDSHLNAYVRLKLALTERHPTIKPYDQERWAHLADAQTAPVESSLKMLEGLHHRWVHLLRAMKPSDFRRTFHHPESGKKNLDWLVQLYAWHGRHHTAHLSSLKRR